MNSHSTITTVFAVFMTVSVNTTGWSADVVWDGSTNTDWTQPDSTSWSGSTYQSGDNVSFLGSGAGTVNISTNGGVTPGNIVVDAAADYIFSGGGIGGNGSLIKSGNGQLTPAVSNSFTGGIEISGGKIRIYDDPNEQYFFGDAGNTITFSGDAQLYNSANKVDMPQGIMVNPGVTAEMRGAYGEATYMTGVLAGNGKLKVVGGSTGWDFRALNTSNTFTGPIEIWGGSGNATLRMRSLADSTNSIGLKSSGTDGGKFDYFSGATSPLILNDRHFVLFNDGDSGTNNDRLPTILSNAGTTNTITINTDLLISGTGSKTLILDGGNTQANTFAGNMPNGISDAPLSLRKQGGGKWILAGSNSYTGKTTLAGGTLVLSGEESIHDSAVVNITSGTLEIATREAIGELQIDGVAVASGIWGTTASGAPNTNDSDLGGTGLLYVGVPFPPEGTVLLVK